MSGSTCVAAFGLPQLDGIGFRIREASEAPVRILLGVDGDRNARRAELRDDRVEIERGS